MATLKQNQSKRISFEYDTKQRTFGYEEIQIQCIYNMQQNPILFLYQK